MSKETLPEIQAEYGALSKATEARFELLATRAYMRAAKEHVASRLNVSNYHALRKHLSVSFAMAIRKECGIILRAASVTPGMVKNNDFMEKARKSASEYRSRKRQETSDMLRKARASLRKLNAEIAEKQAEIENLERRARIAMVRATDGFDAPPPPSIIPTDDGNGLPSDSGIYFVWSFGDIAYVGQSINLRNRVTTRHENIRQGDLVSYIRCPYHLLDYQEAYFIGLCMPLRNFGRRNKLTGHIGGFKEAATSP
jgi:hypothetical protein